MVTKEIILRRWFTTGDYQFIYDMPLWGANAKRRVEFTICAIDFKQCTFYVRINSSNNYMDYRAYSTRLCRALQEKYFAPKINNFLNINPVVIDCTKKE
jgi:hypothetical protein